MNTEQKMKLEFYLMQLNTAAEPLSEIFNEVSDVNENDRNEIIDKFYDNSTNSTDEMFVEIATSPKYMGETIDALNRKYDLGINTDNDDESDCTPLSNDDLVNLLIGRVGVLQAMKLISAEIK